MNNIQKRFLLFLCGCMVIRGLFVYITYKLPPKYLPIAGMLALIPAIGFTTIFITGSRKTGTEVFGDEIWWNSLRPVHALLYLLFAISAIAKKSYSWVFLLVDMLIGLCSFLAYHIHSGNFSKLI